MKFVKYNLLFDTDKNIVGFFFTEFSNSSIHFVKPVKIFSI